MRKHISYYSRIFCLQLVLVFSGEAAFSQEIDTTYIAADTVTTITVEDSYDTNEDDSEGVKVDDLTQDDKTAVAARKIDESKKAELMKDEAFWYANEALNKKKKKEQAKEPSESFTDKQWFKTLLWFIIVGAFVVIIIWFLLSSNVNLFRKKAEPVNREEDNLENENIFDIDYDKQIAKAISNNDYRLAVRYMYLQLLRMMADRNIIQYKQERTNSDYLMQLFKSAYYKDFFRMTRNFEYTWYGQFSLGEPGFKAIQQDYYNFKSRLSH